ncbi:recombinase family protein [Cereibacter changlensis]|uniref:Recombinase family protein n=1 Tax=Cereibacter changlensis TaxID=402884 RepID=A0A4U0Z438_9RHOB|nr:recombinase family protein [Cereibacter changlensis]TKA96223.1 recombinase family protein [Cereibacter changlensis]
MAVYIYTRVSTTDQIDGTSLDEQLRKAKGAAMMYSAEEPVTFTDAGISGSIALADRPEGRKLCDILQPNDTVIASKIDRLFRSASDALVTSQDWKARGILLVITEFGDKPVTENGTARLLFGILSMTAEFERELIRTRVREGRAAKKAKGGHIGGSAPFGYRKVGAGRGAYLEPVPTEQAAIARMVAMKAEGASLRAIAAQIEVEFDLKVSHVAVRNALTRAAAI